MRWILKKLDSMAGTVVAAVTGLAASQLVAFIHAYLQRLGGHIDEARLGKGALFDGRMAGVIPDETLRARIADLAQARIDALEQGFRAIDQAGVFAKPFAFFAHFDRDIALATLHAFQPALPVDAPSLTFCLAGIVLGWIVWETVKSPFRLFRRGVPAARRARS